RACACRVKRRPADVYYALGIPRETTMFKRLAWLAVFGIISGFLGMQPRATNAASEDTLADVIIGQPNMTTYSPPRCADAGVSASTLCNPLAVAVDPAGNVYVVDQDTNRVLEYDSPATTDSIADRVFGQPNFTGRSCNVPTSASTLCYPNAVALDEVG